MLTSRVQIPRVKKNLPSERVLTLNVIYGAFTPAGALRPSTPWPSSDGAVWPSSVTARDSTAASRAGIKPDGDSSGSYVSMVTS